MRLSHKAFRRKLRRGHKRALGAVRHSILTATWHMLSTGELYRDPGAEYFERRQSPERRVKALVAKLEGFGQRVTLEPAVT